MNNELIEFRCKAVTYLRRHYLRYSKSRIKSKDFYSHVTYYASNNVGDTVLSDTIRNLFDGKGQSRWNLIDVSNPVDEKTIKGINETKAVIIGGGGLFLPDTNKNKISGWQWPCSKQLLNEISVPIIIYAVGFNYFRGSKVDDLFCDALVEVIKKSSFVGLRNHGSIREVKKIIPEELWGKIIFQPCITTLISKLNYSLQPKKKNNKVAINIAFDRIDQRLGNRKDEVLKKIAEAVKEIENKGYEINYIAHIVKDLEFKNYLDEANVSYKVVVASSWSAETLIRFYRDVGMVIGMRGHAQMIPFGVNTHILTLGSHNKMKWFLEDIDAEDWYIELSDDSVDLKDEIISKFICIHEKEYELTDQRLKNAQNKLYEITLDNLKQIQVIINSKSMA